MVLSVILKDLRNERKLTQKAVAISLGISPTCYAGYEQGVHEPDLKTLKKISTYFGVPSDYLLGLVTDEVQLTNAEKRAGASNRMRADLSPLEDDMLFAFREIGKKYGESGQKASLSILEAVLKF